MEPDIEGPGRRGNAGLYKVIEALKNLVLKLSQDFWYQLCPDGA